MPDQVLFSPQRALDANANPVTPTDDGGPWAYVYVSGTEALADIYDADGVALENPLEANANGIFVPVFADGAVKITVKTGAGVTLPGYPIDPAPKIPTIGAASTIAFDSQDNLPRENVQAALEFVADRVDAVEDGLGDLAAQDVADLTRTQSVWNTGTNASESLISPAKLNAKIAQQRPIFTSAAQTITSGGLVTVTHGLGVVPRVVGARLKCLTAEAGYSINDEIAVDLINNTTSSGNRYNGVLLTTTQISVRFSAEANVFITGHATTGVATGLTNANWSLILTAAL